MFQFLARKRRRLLKDHISKNDNEMIRRKINLRNAFPRLHLHSPSTKALIKHPPWGGGPPKQHTPPQLAAHPNSTTPACFASASSGRHPLYTSCLLLPSEARSWTCITRKTRALVGTSPGMAIELPATRVWEVDLGQLLSMGAATRRVCRSHPRRSCSKVGSGSSAGRSVESQSIPHRRDDAALFS